MCCVCVQGSDNCHMQTVEEDYLKSSLYCFTCSVWAKLHLYCNCLNLIKRRTLVREELECLRGEGKGLTIVSSQLVLLNWLCVCVFKFYNS